MRIVFTLFLIWATCQSVFSQNDTLPIVKIYGQFGYDYQPATLIIEGDTLQCRIKWRGGTTNGADKHKRNYKIELSEDRSYFGLRSDNHWLLDAGQADVFRLRNLIANEIWGSFVASPYYSDRKPKARSSISGRVVEVYLNDQYEGIYALTENMDRKQMQIRKTDPSDGHIRGCLWKSVGYGTSMMTALPPAYDNSLETWDVFEAKYPEPGDDADTTDYRPLYEAIKFVARSNNQDFCDHVEEYFDLPVVIDYYLFIYVLNAVDNIGKNVFWAIFDKSSGDKRLTPAIWDCDATAGQRWVAKYQETMASPYYFKSTTMYLLNRLMWLNAADFNRKAILRYWQLRKTVLSTDSLCSRYRHYNDLLQRTGAAQREQERWSGDSDVDGSEIDFNAETDYICDWLQKHLDFLDTKLPETIAAGITPSIVDPQPSSNFVYTLSGQRTDYNRLSRGIYIVNGKKYIRK